MFTTGAEDRLFTLTEPASLLMFQICDSFIGLVFPLIAQSFVEHERQDVVLVILPCSLATEYVRCTPKVGFELLSG